MPVVGSITGSGSIAVSCHAPPGSHSSRKATALALSPRSPLYLLISMTAGSCQCGEFHSSLGLGSAATAAIGRPLTKALPRGRGILVLYLSAAMAANPNGGQDCAGLLPARSRWRHWHVVRLAIPLPGCPVQRPGSHCSSALQLQRQRLSHWALQFVCLLRRSTHSAQHRPRPGHCALPSRIWSHCRLLHPRRRAVNWEMISQIPIIQA